MNATKAEIHEFLLALRDSGQINMFGAGPYLQEAFGLSRSEAKQALLDWVKDMSQPRPAAADQASA